MSVITITSDDILSDIDCPFKVSAGPGAGKTYWLVNQIKNVLYNSDKLFKSRKVACITYTNIAVETILKRLGTSAEQVEVSTIHSFFYKHVVKPYASFIAVEYGLNVSEIDGHDDLVLSNYGFLNEWKTKTGQQRIRDDKTVVDAFKNLKWKFENGELKIKTDHPYRADGYSIRNDSYLEYKKMMWAKGNVHHDDVLFFSYQIVNKFPFVVNVLTAKFPYLFIDEFQDSNPIQVEIFKVLGANTSVIGVIGNVVQSIYGFQGADYTQLSSFSLPNIKKYVLKENRRSSNEIIEVLNKIRIDISQTKQRNISIQKPIIYIGDMALALREVKTTHSSEKIHTLSRHNITSNAMKAEISGTTLDYKLLEKLKEVDSNSNRSNLIYSCIKATAYAKENKFQDAIKELEKLFNYKTDKEKGKRKALKFISTLIENYSIYKDGSLREYSEFIREKIDSGISKVSSGAIKTFYDNYTFAQLYLCVAIPDDISLHKTIHKAKGDEFDNVFLVLKEEGDLEFLLSPDFLSNTNNSEEHRVNYVAISRAKNRLFISVPTLNPTSMATLQTHFDFKTV